MMQLQFPQPTQIPTSVVETPQQTTTPGKIVPVTSHISHTLTSILYPLGRRVLIPFYFRRMEVTGTENIPKTGPVILAPTHRSRWDGLVMAFAAGKPVTGRDLRFMISENEMAGPQGWVLRRTGGFPVNTKHPGISSIRHSVEILRNGEALVMFPEGNIYRHGHLNPLKPGMARIALQVESLQPNSGLKIVPIGLNYDQPIPTWRSDIKVNIGKPLEVANYCTGSTKKNAQQLTQDLEMALTELERR